MVRSRFSALKPVVFRLAAALEKYQADFDVLVRSRFDPGLCRAVIRELGEIQNLSAALPQLAADMLEVITRHVELLGLLFRRGGGGGAPGGVPSRWVRRRSAACARRIAAPWMPCMASACGSSPATPDAG